MICVTLVLATFAAAAPAAPAAGRTPAEVLQAANTPPELTARLAAAKALVGQTVDHTTVNPFYLRGDFDGDRKADYIVGLWPLDTGVRPAAPRLLVLLGGGKRRAIWLDHREDFATPRNDVWYVVDRARPLPARAEGTPRLGDAIYIADARTAGVLTWHGSGFDFVWTHD